MTGWTGGRLDTNYNWKDDSGIDWSQVPGIDSSGLEGPSTPLSKGDRSEFAKKFLEAFTKGLSTLDRGKYRKRAEEGDFTMTKPAVAGGTAVTGGMDNELLTIFPPSIAGGAMEFETPGSRGLASTLAGVAAPMAAFIPGAGPFVSAGLTGLSRTGW